MNYNTNQNGNVVSIRAVYCVHINPSLSLYVHVLFMETSHIYLFIYSIRNNAYLQFHAACTHYKDVKVGLIQL